jgi:peroxiredoxin
MQCRYHVGQLGRLYPQFQSSGTEILVILGAKIEQAKSYAESLHTPFPVLADPDRTVYKLFGLEKAMLIIQRTASVVVDRKGIIRYIKRVTNPMTWLQESQELTEFIQTLAKDKS